MGLQFGNAIACDQSIPTPPIELAVCIGRDFGDLVEVLAGLAASDEIVVNSSDSLTSGTRVQVSDDGH